ncbi:MAG TPA: hypothetical protein VF785_20355 [Gemmatimonadaceae bacterium]
MEWLVKAFLEASLAWLGLGVSLGLAAQAQNTRPAAGLLGIETRSLHVRESSP